MGIYKINDQLYEWIEFNWIELNIIFSYFRSFCEFVIELEWILFIKLLNF
jgi:hypothetical protein